jgi:hypothetical protein
MTETYRPIFDSMVRGLYGHRSQDVGSDLMLEWYRTFKDEPNEKLQWLFKRLAHADLGLPDPEKARKLYDGTPVKTYSGATVRPCKRCDSGHPAITYGTTPLDICWSCFWEIVSKRLGRRPGWQDDAVKWGLPT